MGILIVNETEPSEFPQILRKEEGFFNYKACVLMFWNNMSNNDYIYVCVSVYGIQRRRG